MRKLLATAVACMVATGALATENGLGAYPNGAEGFMAGAVPPPGQYLVNYFMFYGADDLMDANGNELPLDFEATAYAEVLRFINVTPHKILGGFWAQHIFVPVTYLDLTTPAGSDDTVGLGDHVTVLEKGYSEPEVYHIVGAAEANPREGRISHKSPLGQALMNCKVGDKVTVNAPDGDIVFRIKAIE